VDASTGRRGSGRETAEVYQSYLLQTRTFGQEIVPAKRDLDESRDVQSQLLRRKNPEQMDLQQSYQAYAQNKGTLATGQFITLNEHTVQVERYLSQGVLDQPLLWALR
jgi:hypothetical protein